MHVLKVADTEPSPTAGVSGLTLAAGREMAKRGHRVDFWFTPDLLPRLRTPGLRRLIVPWLVAWRVLGLTVRGRAPDVVEVHEPLGAVVAALCRLPWPALPVCVVFSHGLELLGWRAGLRMARAHERRVALKSRLLVPATLLSQTCVALRLAASVLVVSESDRRYLLEHWQLADDRVTCCSTAVLLEESGPAAGERQHSTAGLRVVFLGSWIERKGTIELEQAWRDVERAREDVSLTIAGAGSSGGAQAAAQRLQSATVVSSVSRHELAQLLDGHDVFVLASWFEGMSLALLEAAAAGLACIVTPVAGSLDVFPGGELDGALMVDPGDARGLADALLRLADTPELRRELGIRARGRAEVFTLARCVDLQLAAYEAALARARRAAP